MDKLGNLPGSRSCFRDRNRARQGTAEGGDAKGHRGRVMYGATRILLRNYCFFHISLRSNYSERKRIIELDR